MKVSGILVISVIIKLHIVVILRNIFDRDILLTKKDIISLVNRNRNKLYIIFIITIFIAHLFSDSDGHNS